MTEVICNVCEQPIDGRYYENDWGETWCASHAIRQCHYCGRLEDQQAGESNCKETPRCTICANSSLKQPELLARISATVRNWMRSEGMETPDGIGLRLVASLDGGRGGLNSAQRMLGQAHGSTVCENGVWRLEKAEVRIVRALPLDLCYGVMAHELTHIFLYQFPLDHWADWQSEGFCEAIAYRWFQQRQTERNRRFACQIAQNADPVYGDGFRSVQASLERHGWPRLLRAVMQEGRLLPA